MSTFNGTAYAPTLRAGAPVAAVAAEKPILTSMAGPVVASVNSERAISQGG